MNAGALVLSARYGSGLVNARNSGKNSTGLRLLPLFDKQVPSRLRRHHAGFLLLAFAVCASPHDANATARVTVPLECGTAQDFEIEVNRRLTKDVILPSTAVQIERDGQGYRLRMQVGNEHREFWDADCRTLFNAAVVVSVSLAQSIARPDVSKAQSAKSEPAAERENGTNDFRLGAALGAGANLGLLPNAAFVFEVEGRASFRRFGFAANVRYLPQATEEDERGRGVSVEALGAQAALFWEPSDWWQARLGASFYRLNGTGLGSPATTSDSVWAGGPTAGLMLIPVRRGDFWFGLGAEAQLDLIRPRFEIREYREVFRPSLFGASAFLRVGHLFF